MSKKEQKNDGFPEITPPPMNLVRVETPEDMEVFTARMAEYESLRTLNAQRVEQVEERGQTDLAEIHSIAEQEARLLSDVSWIHALWHHGFPIQAILIVTDTKDETSRLIRDGESRIVFNAVTRRQKNKKK